MSGAAKKELHELIEALPPSETHAARRYLEYLRDMGSDPVYRALMSAPIDDEPETSEEKAAVKTAKEQLARGEIVAWARVKRQLKGKR